MVWSMSDPGLYLESIVVMMIFAAKDARYGTWCTY